MGYTTGIQWTYDLVKQCFEDKGYILIDDKYINAITNLTFIDNEGYYYYQSLSNFLNKDHLRFSVYNPYTIQNIKLWLIINNKSIELISAKFTKAIHKLKWKCLICGEYFECEWSIIQSGHGCGVCRGFQVGLSNCLAIKNSELAKQWHPTKNGDLTPYDVTSNSNKKVWWQCDKGHEWQCSINNRSSGNKCPYCSGKFPSKDYNLLICNPELCEEWDYERNDKNPEDYTPGSSQKVWWICKECNHKWEDSISHRTTSNRGCHFCNTSYGEREIKKFLTNNKINFKHQIKYNDLRGINNGKLSYDFYLLDYNILIEYQGKQHEKYISRFHKTYKDFEKQQEHDKRKREYAHINNIKLLEIWYWDFDNIEQILFDYLKTQKEAS